MNGWVVAVPKPLAVSVTFIFAVVAAEVAVSRNWPGACQAELPSCLALVVTVSVQSSTCFTKITLSVVNLLETSLETSLALDASDPTCDNAIVLAWDTIDSGSDMSEVVSLSNLESGRLCDVDGSSSRRSCGSVFEMGGWSTVLINSRSSVINRLGTKFLGKDCLDVCW